MCVECRFHFMLLRTQYSVCIMQSAIQLINVTLLSFSLTQEEGLHTADSFRPS